MGVIHYKFKSEREFKQHTFPGTNISPLDLKNGIAKEANLGLLEDYDLLLCNAQTNQEYKEGGESIPRNISLIVRRVPVVRGKLPKGKTAALLASKEKEAEKLREKEAEKIASSLQRAVGAPVTEEERIKDMLAQSSDLYTHQAELLALKSGASLKRFKNKQPQDKLPPPNYVCYNCGKKGHLNRFCEEVDSKVFNKIKKTTGIPRNLLRPVTEEEKGGNALVTPEGQFVMAFADETTWKMTAAKEKLAEIDLGALPERLKCGLCKNVLHSPVLLFCCRRNSCESCIKDLLANNHDSKCPFCKVPLRADLLKADQALKNDLERELSRLIRHRKGQAESGGKEPEKQSEKRLSQAQKHRRTGTSRSDQYNQPTKKARNR